jgi:type II restriction endonuclease EcoO109I-like protein
MKPPWHEAMDREVPIALERYYRRVIDKADRLTMAWMIEHGHVNTTILRANGVRDAQGLVKAVLSGHLYISRASMFGEVYQQVASTMPGVVRVVGAAIDYHKVLPDGTVKGYAQKSGVNQLNTTEWSGIENKFATWMQYQQTGDATRFVPIVIFAYGWKLQSGTFRPFNADKKVAKPKTAVVREKPLKNLGHRMYQILTGQDAWADLTGDRDAYLVLGRIVEAASVNRPREYRDLQEQTEARLIRELGEGPFCHDDRVKTIDYDALEETISSSKAKKDEPEAAPNGNQHRIDA